MAVSVLTVGLWCFNSKLQVYMGEMGVIAILPLVAFFGFGILNKVSRWAVLVGGCQVYLAKQQVMQSSEWPQGPVLAVAWMTVGWMDVMAGGCIATAA